ncbi:MAG: serine/threonine protein kinase, partial [Myxococcales bacterium]|nr:serine/threonine protein kinase [Myxococcales bacterium]
MRGPSIAIGDVLSGKWRVDALLGEGGMGAVFAATHLRTGHPVAIKLLRAGHDRDPELCERLRREGYAANRIRHPGVVAVLDDGVTADGAPYLVMERLVGEPLDLLAERRGGSLSPAEVGRLGERWLEVIAAAHARGVIHRDLKPENAFLCADGSLKVLDFGIAQVRGDSAPRLTATGVPMGTPAFMPREQALALWDQVDTRSDVYALAASLFTLLTGRLVHEAQSGPELLVMVSTVPVPPVRSVAPYIPPGFAAVLDRALSFYPRDRFRDAGEMLTALRAALAADEGRATPVFDRTTRTIPTHARTTERPVSTSASRRMSRPRARWVAAAAVLLAGASGIAFAWVLWEPAATVPVDTAAITATEPL